MTSAHFFVSAWNWNPWLLALCAAAILTYCIKIRSRVSRNKIGWLLAGVTLFFFALASPIEVLANGYLFSAHMLQHLLLLLIVPPLILLSLPSLAAPDRFPSGPWNGLNGVLRRPLVAWFLGVGGMWIWHAHTLCNAAVTYGGVHALQYVTLLLMGLAFWWPIIGPRSHERLSPLAGVVYLFSACVACTLLGIILTFAPVEVCSVYLHPQDRLGILALIRDDWGLTAAKDQQLGGLLMWIPACLIYFCGIIGLLFRWYAEYEDTGDRATVFAFPTKNSPEEPPS